MSGILRRLAAALLAVLVVLGFSDTVAVPAAATTEHCPTTAGWVKISQGGVLSLPYTVPAGKIVTAYCAKSATEAVTVPVNPPAQAGTTITVWSQSFNNQEIRQNISYFSVLLQDAEPDCEADTDGAEQDGACVKVVRTPRSVPATCDTPGESYTEVATTTYTYDEESDEWVAGEGDPVLTKENVQVIPQLDCSPGPEDACEELDGNQPEGTECTKAPLVVPTSREGGNCEDGFWSQTGTITTSYGFDSESKEWDAQESVTEWSGVQVPRETTEADGCNEVQPPNPPLPPVPPLPPTPPVDVEDPEGPEAPKPPLGPVVLPPQAGPKPAPTALPATGAGDITGVTTLGGVLLAAGLVLMRRRRVA